ncbi:MAG: hypothetical protein ABSC15_15445 [Terriglobales bacterium]|jgi:hypothetical protein
MCFEKDVPEHSDPKPEVVLKKVKAKPEDLKIEDREKELKSEVHQR